MYLNPSFANCFIAKVLSTKFPLVFSRHGGGGGGAGSGGMVQGDLALICMSLDEFSVHLKVCCDWLQSEMES